MCVGAEVASILRQQEANRQVRAKRCWTCVESFSLGGHDLLTAALFRQSVPHEAAHQDMKSNIPWFSRRCSDAVDSVVQTADDRKRSRLTVVVSPLEQWPQSHCLCADQFLYKKEKQLLWDIGSNSGRPKYFTSIMIKSQFRFRPAQKSVLSAM